ncbi:hypothetical protein DPMN_141255 [Dreissena polymorpha]|uniref:Uncharacterized protein n=1 Tax=Dreissena polymorpha TaxID=45954 RepID=A0A9D4G944_DREPO|nr:hypothetical protein DPMN_141255 [Dreissena polymorpha]
MLVVNRNKNKHWKTTCRPVWKATDCCLADTPSVTKRKKKLFWMETVEIKENVITG